MGHLRSLAPPRLRSAEGTAAGSSTLQWMHPIALAPVFLTACTDPPTEPAFVAAPGVTVERVAMDQAVERDLMLDGEDVDESTVPLVAGRPGVVRVFDRTDDAYDGREVTGRLTTSVTPRTGRSGSVGTPSIATSSSIPAIRTSWGAAMPRGFRTTRTGRCTSAGGT